VFVVVSAGGGVVLVSVAVEGVVFDVEKSGVVMEDDVAWEVSVVAGVGVELEEVEESVVEVEESGVAVVEVDGAKV